MPLCLLTSWWLLRPMPSFHAPFWPTSPSSSFQSWWLFRQRKVKRNQKHKCLQIFILLLLSCLGHSDTHQLLFVSHIPLSLCSPCTWLESWLLLKRHKVYHHPQVLVGWLMLHNSYLSSSPSLCLQTWKASSVANRVLGCRMKIFVLHANNKRKENIGKFPGLITGIALCANISRVKFLWV